MSLAWSDPESSRERPKQDVSLPLFDQAHARHSDPKPSHEAAASVVNLGRTRDAILAILRCHGGMTDEGIAFVYGECRAVAPIGFPQVSPSGLRSRRSELVRLGFVRQVGTDKTKAGRACSIWGIADRPAGEKA